MVLPHEIYIDQLALPLGGCPIWGSLHPQRDPVDIADVGYLSEDGGWIKLFNLRTENDPKNLPSSYRPGSVVITDQDIECDIQGNTFGNRVEAGLSYECAEEKGAILFVAEDAVTRNALNKIQLAKLVQENVENWMEFAKRKGRNVRITDLVLVTGYVRTTTWVAAVFGQKSQWCKFKVGGVLPIGGAKLELWGSLDVNAFAWTGGPEEYATFYLFLKITLADPLFSSRMKTGSPLDTTHFLKHTASNISPPALLCKDDPRHQCVLIRGYRMAGRTWLELLPFKKKKVLKGIEMLKRSPRNLENSDVLTVDTLPMVIDADTTVTIDTDAAMVLDTNPELPQQTSTSGAIYEDDSLEGLSPDNNEVNRMSSESSLRGGSSNLNRRGRGSRRTRRRGHDSTQDGNYGNRRRDGGAGAGSSSGGSSDMGHQSGLGGAANSGGQSSGTGETTQQRGKTSGNTKDALELELDQSRSEKDLYKSVWITDNFGGISESEESESSGSECSGDSVEVIPSPWDVFLEYLLQVRFTDWVEFCLTGLLQTEEKANYAIIHDDDFSILPPEVKSTSELRAQLQILRPRVYLNGSVGMLKPTALEFFRSTGYFCQTDPEGLAAYFPKLFPSTPAGSFGSESLFAFSDYRENPEILFATLKKIYIHAQTHIHSIQCEYQGPERKMLLGNKHGNSGEAPLYVFELNMDEYIVKIRGSSRGHIEQLQFFTNKGRASSIYGGSGGDPFVWTVDQDRYPDSPGLHHFEGTYEKYLRTLTASFPIYPWFEDGIQSVASESETTNNNQVRIRPNIETTIFTVDEVWNILMVFSKDTTGNVRHIQVDAAFKLLQETEGRACVSRNLEKVVKMLYNPSQPSALHYASTIIAELARIGGSELEIRDMLLFSTFDLIDNEDGCILLKKLSKYAQFRQSIIAVLPNIIHLLRNNNFDIRTSAANAIGKLVEREVFRQQFKEYIPVLICSLTDMLKEDSLFTQLSGRNTLIKLSQLGIVKWHALYKSGDVMTLNFILEEYHGAIVENVPNFLNLVDNENSLVKENGILLLAELAGHAAFRSEILHLLLPDILTPSKPHNLNQSTVWVSVLAASMKHDENLDYYVSQLIGMLEDNDENIRNKSADVIMELLRYVQSLDISNIVKNLSLVFRLIDLTTRPTICKVNGVNALLAISEEATYGNTVSTVVSQAIPDLIKMLRSNNWKQVVDVLQRIAERSEFRQEITKSVPGVISILQQNIHLLELIELLTALSEYTTLVPLMTPLGIPLIKEMFMWGKPEMIYKGITILLNIFKQVGLGEYKNTVTNTIKEVALDIAITKSFILQEPFSPYLLQAEHTLELKLSFFEDSAKYVNGTELLKLLSHQVEFQSPILEAIPVFVETAKGPNHTSVYDILKNLLVHG
ncbi:hypothetical protein Clacol_010469 [Clathrus columnatus]|uniref:Jacalin-type lectin domain-containing protein n=1 Tax=Clathrus columnatus TaxID=1419009 RepID=A0AAV5ASQ8_9AGAM|nr:hypothetical protein Clacol_010469 [Clathrus columnatus]